ncbi:unnamed protein product, partial [Ectocarpus sp. 12 AP-2014]
SILEVVRRLSTCRVIPDIQLQYRFNMGSHWLGKQNATCLGYAEPASPPILTPPPEAKQPLLCPKCSCCARGYNTAATIPLGNARGKARQPNKNDYSLKDLDLPEPTPGKLCVHAHAKRKLSTPKHCSPPPLISLDELVSPATPSPRR